MPLTLQTAVIFVIGFTLPLRYGVFSVMLYIALGMLGLPVFAGGRAGVDVLAGPTGGFIIGFIITVIVVFYLSKSTRKNADKHKYGYLISRVIFITTVATIILQACGIIWGKIYTGSAWPVVLDGWLHPFYFNMVFKILIASFAAVHIWRRFPATTNID